MAAGRRYWSLLGIAVVVIAASVGLRSEPAASGPLEPEVRKKPDPVALDDGFNHVIVHVSDAGSEAAPPHDGPGLHLTDGGEIDSDDLTQLPEGSELRVRADDESSDDDTTPPPARPRQGGPFAGVAGIEEATPIGGGYYALTTTLDDHEVDALPRVGQVEQDVWLEPDAAPDDPALTSEWGLENDGQTVSGWPGRPDADVDATTAWTGADGTGVVVAVLDTGVDVTHPDLASQIWSNPDENCTNGVDDDANGLADDCQGWDFFNNDSTVADPGSDYRHGTHIAGTIAAATNNGVGIAGLAPGARIMPLKVGDGSGIRRSSAIAAVYYAVDEGAQVINASWGGPYSSAQESAVQHALAEGVVIVASAGNSADNLDVTPRYPGSYTHANVVTVGASTNGELSASFSTYGKTSVDLFAPGQFVWSTLPGGYGSMSGTSMAAPHVAGAVAVLLSHGLPWRQAIDRMLDTVDLAPAYSGRSVTGGRLNLASALGLTDLPVAIRFTGLRAAREPQQTIGIDAFVGSLDDLPRNHQYAYRVTLAVEHEGRPWLITREDTEWHHRTGSGVSPTNDEGWMVLPPGGFHLDQVPALGGPTDNLALMTSLPAGQYAAMVEFIDLSNGGIAVSPPQAGFFTVGPATAAAPAPGGASGAPSTTPTTAPNAGPAPSPSIVPPSGGTGTSIVAGGGTATTVPAPSPGSGSIVASPGQPAGGQSGSGSTVPGSGNGNGQGPAPSTTTTTVSGGSSGGSGETSPGTPNPNVQPGPGGSVVLTEPSPVFAVTAIDPASGPRDGGTLVKIQGKRLPSEPFVDFGGVPARVVTDWAPTMLIVETGAHAPGLVELRISASGGRREQIEGVFTYLGSNGSTTPGSGGPSTTVAPSGAPSTETSIVNAPSGGSGGSGGASGGTPAQPPGDGGPLTITVNGLRLGHIGPGHPLVTETGMWGYQCQRPSCAGVVLGPPTNRVASTAVFSSDSVGSDSDSEAVDSDAAAECVKRNKGNGKANGHCKEKKKEKG